MPDPKWFQPRPSANNYAGDSSGASNLGPNSDDLLKAVDDRRKAVAEFDGVDPASVPADALTASGSGLDPHISVAYAKEQVDRVAKERNLSADTLNRLIDKYTRAWWAVRTRSSPRSGLRAVRAPASPGSRRHRSP
ncbi:potassium-transporting ATPase subunit C [Kitasatospora sp. NPDC028055]|uniref:potassium-transporting ATPase subunit C n=1 Tax=Kitasatospora sp. NPDC028055 TaxID=3155653 RepID=UPI0033D13F79